MTALSIRLDSVSVRFRHQVKGEINAVEDVSLEVRPGELMTLLGPSGCGKTTTLRLIAGFQQPSEGRIFIGASEVTNVEANARGLGFVFQNYALFPHLSVRENVAYGLKVQRKSAEEVARSVGEVLSLVGLEGYEQQMPHQLSGGEQQRVALARAIVIRPRVLLFDEPLSNLDAKLRVDMRSEVRSLQKRLGITAVYVTHDQEEAMAISDRIAVMSKGRIMQLGTAEDLYRRPASAFIARFIGRANLIPALVASQSAGATVLDIAGARHAVDATGAQAGQGATVLAVVRPEAVAISSVPTEGAITATMRSRTYLGEKAECLVEVGGTRILVLEANPAQWEDQAINSTVYVRLPRAMHLLQGEEQ